MQVQGQSLLLGGPQLKGKEELQIIFSWILRVGGQAALPI